MTQGTAMNYPEFEYRKAVAGTAGLTDRPDAHTIYPEKLEAEAFQMLQQARDLAAKEAIEARIKEELALAEATQALLTHIRQLVVEQTRSVNGSKPLSRFIKELQPLAQTYGVRIVKVGNGELATLVLASAK